MKRMDLRKTRAATIVGGSVGLDDDEDLVLDNAERKPRFNFDLTAGQVISIVVKLSILVSGVFVVKYFEEKNIDQFNAQKAVVTGELSKLESKKKKLKEEINNFDSLKVKADEFNNKLGIMQQLAHERLSVVTGLDHIQTVIPQKVWLDKIIFSKNTFQIEGVTTTNKELQNFVESLEQTGVFSNVHMSRVGDDKSSRVGNVGSSFTRRQFLVETVLK